MAEEVDGRVQFERAVEFIGEDWLEEQDEYYQEQSQKPTPEIIQQYHRALRDLNYVEDEFEGYFPGVMTSTLELASLGRYLEYLDDASVVDPHEHEEIDATLEDRFAPRLREPDEYLGALYELRTAGLYATRGYTPQFIDETQEFETPDILIRTPDKVFVECKKISSLSSDESKQNSINNLLVTKTTKHLHPDHVAVFVFSEHPSREEADSIHSRIPQGVNGMKDRFDLPYGSVTIYNVTELYDVAAIWTTNSNSDIGKRFADAYDIFLRPLVRRTSGKDIDCGDLLARAEFNPDRQRTQIGFTDLRFACAVYEINRDRVSRAVKQLDAASGKFSSDTPNVLHIDFPVPVDDEQSEELRQEIGKRLNIKPKISGVAITHLDRSREKTEVEINYKGASIKNLDPFTALPDSFDLPGKDLT